MPFEESHNYMLQSRDIKCISHRGVTRLGHFCGAAVHVQLSYHRSFPTSDRPTRTAAELSPEELRAGAAALDELVARYRPRALAVLGITAYRLGFGRPRAAIGLQPERVGGAATWVVPNPSGLNAHHQLPDLARLYGQLRPPAG